MGAAISAILIEKLFGEAMWSKYSYDNTMTFCEKRKDACFLPNVAFKAPRFLAELRICSMRCYSIIFLNLFTVRICDAFLIRASMLLAFKQHYGGES